MIVILFPFVVVVEGMCCCCCRCRYRCHRCHRRRRRRRCRRRVPPHTLGTSGQNLFLEFYCPRTKTNLISQTFVINQPIQDGCQRVTSSKYACQG